MFGLTGDRGKWNGRRGPRRAAIGELKHNGRRPEGRRPELCREASRRCQTLRTLDACRPFGPRVTSNSTASFSASDLKPSPWIAEKWTNTSSPFSCEMNPKPFASLNHFTVPRATLQLLEYRGQSPIKCRLIRGGSARSLRPGLRLAGGLPQEIRQGLPGGLER